VGGIGKEGRTQVSPFSKFEGERRERSCSRKGPLWRTDDQQRSPTPVKKKESVGSQDLGPVSSPQPSENRGARETSKRFEQSGRETHGT